MTVSELLARMSGLEFEEWKEFWKLEPFGEWRKDLRAGSIASPLYNAATGKKTKPGDWVMAFEPPAPQSPDQLKAMLKGLALAAKAHRRTPRRPKRRRGRDNHR